MATAYPLSSDNILAETQRHVCDLLNADSCLSSIGYFPENALDIEFQLKNNLLRQGIVGIVMTPTATFAGKNDQNDLVWELKDLTIMTTENCAVNRTKQNSMTGQDASMRVLDVLCKQNYGTFSPISYEQGEDAGLLVNKVTVKCLVQPENNL